MSSVLRHDVWPLLLLTLVMMSFVVMFLRDPKTTKAFRGWGGAVIGSLFVVACALRIVDAVLRADGVLLALGCVDLIIVAALAFLVRRSDRARGDDETHDQR